MYTAQVCDLPVDHPSCSKQHAVLQYRLVEYEKKDGSTGKRVRYMSIKGSARCLFEAVISIAMGPPRLIFNVQTS